MEALAEHKTKSRHWQQNVVLPQRIWCRRGESEFGTRLTRRKLLILLNGKNAENTEFAQVRYTAGTRSFLLAVRQNFRREPIPLALFEVRFLLHVNVRRLAKGHWLSRVDWHGVSLDPFRKVHENLLQSFVKRLMLLLIASPSRHVLIPQLSHKK